MSIHWTLIAGFLYAEIGKNATTKTRQEPGTCETEIQMTSYRHNSAPPGSFYIHQDVEQGALYILYLDQSVTSRLETSRYRDLSQFFESIGLGLENFGLEKSLGIGLENI